MSHPPPPPPSAQLQLHSSLWRSTRGTLHAACTIAHMSYAHGYALILGHGVSHSLAGSPILWDSMGSYGRGGGGMGPVDRGVWTAKTVKRPRQQPAHPQYANYWAPLTRKRHTMPHSAQPQHTNYWAPRTRKRHQQEHRPQRPTESSDPTQHAKGRTGDCPGPRKGATTRRNVTQGGRTPHDPAPPTELWLGLYTGRIQQLYGCTLCGCWHTARALVGFLLVCPPSPPPPPQGPAFWPGTGPDTSNKIPPPPDTEALCQPPPPCASTGLSKHAVGVEPAVLRIFWDCCFLWS